MPPEASEGMTFASRTSVLGRLTDLGPPLPARLSPLFGDRDCRRVEFRVGEGLLARSMKFMAFVTPVIPSSWAAVRGACVVTGLTVDFNCDVGRFAFIIVDV
jgi:hypothetical protein